MPYGSIDELPESVKGLPVGAKKIFMAAFNAAYDEYDGDEETCMKVAWAAVKKAYKKDENGKWVKKEGQKALSFEEIAQRVRAAWNEQFNHKPDIPGVYQDVGWVQDVFPDFCIVRIYDKGLYQYPYALGEMGVVEFGEPKEVEVEYKEKTLLDKVADLFERLLQKVTGKAPEPVPAPRAMSGKVTLIRDQKTGKRRWLGVPTSAFYPDREKEGLSQKALEEAVANLWRDDGLKTKTADPVYLDIWHVDPVIIGQADCVGMCGPFVVATGLEADNLDAKTFFDWMEGHPEEDIRMSILFDSDPAQQTAEGVYTGGVDLLRFTVAPAGVVANPVTAFLAVDAKVSGGDGMKMDKKARPFLAQVLGEERVQEIETELAESEQKALDAGYERKAKVEGEEATSTPAAETTPATETSPEPTPEEKKEEPPATEPEKKPEQPAEEKTTPPEQPITRAEFDALRLELQGIKKTMETGKTQEPAPADNPSPLRRHIVYPAGDPAQEKTAGAVNESGVPKESPLKKR